MKTIVIYELRLRITKENFRNQVCFWNLNFDRAAGSSNGYVAAVTRPSLSLVFYKEKRDEALQTEFLSFAMV